MCPHCVIRCLFCSFRESALEELHEFFCQFTLGLGQRGFRSTRHAYQSHQRLNNTHEGSFFMYKGTAAGQTRYWSSLAPSHVLSRRVLDAVLFQKWVASRPSAQGGALLQHGSWMAERPEHTCPVLQGTLTGSTLCSSFSRWPSTPVLCHCHRLI